MKIQILSQRLEPQMLFPKTRQSAGIDLYACRLEDEVELQHDMSLNLYLGVAVAIPEGYVGLLTPRSSTGKRGLRLTNSTGIIDSDYRGELIAQVRTDHVSTVIKPMDRLFQLVVVKHLEYDLDFVSELPPTERGSNGFGSTG